MDLSICLSGGLVLAEWIVNENAPPVQSLAGRDIHGLLDRPDQSLLARLVDRFDADIDIQLIKTPKVGQRCS